MATSRDRKCCTCRLGAVVCVVILTMVSTTLCGCGPTTTTTTKRPETTTTKPPEITTTRTMTTRTTTTRTKTTRTTTTQTMTTHTTTTHTTTMTTRTMTTDTTVTHTTTTSTTTTLYPCVISPWFFYLSWLSVVVLGLAFLGYYSYYSCCVANADINNSPGPSASGPQPQTPGLQPLDSHPQPPASGPQSQTLGLRQYIPFAVLALCAVFSAWWTWYLYHAHVPEEYWSDMQYFATNEEELLSRVPASNLLLFFVQIAFCFGMCLLLNMVGQWCSRRCCCCGQRRESNVITKTFEPGCKGKDHGLTCDTASNHRKKFEVVEVTAQAQDEGVQLYWQLEKIDNLKFSEELLDQKHSGTSPYVIEFKKPSAKSALYTVYLVIQIVLSFVGVINIMVAAWQHTPFVSPLATVNYAMMLTVNSSHTITGVSFTVEWIMENTRRSRSKSLLKLPQNQKVLLIAFYILLVCTCATPIWVMLTLSFPALVLYVWIPFMVAFACHVAKKLSELQTGQSMLDLCRLDGPILTFLCKIGVTALILVIVQFIPSVGSRMVFGRLCMNDKDYWAPLTEEWVSRINMNLFYANWALVSKAWNTVWAEQTMAYRQLAEDGLMMNAEHAPGESYWQNTALINFLNMF